MVEREEYVRRATITLRYFDYKVTVLSLGKWYALYPRDCALWDAGIMHVPWKVDCVRRNKGDPDLFAPALPGRAVSLMYEQSRPRVLSERKCFWGIEIFSPLKWIHTSYREEEQAMKKKTYTLNIRQTGTFQYEVTVPEIGATKMAATLDSALTITLHDILKHLTTRYLILVFADHDADREEQGVDPQACPPTDLEHQTAREVAHLGFAPQVQRRERHLVFEVTRPQITWLDEHAGKLFDRYFFKDEREV